jgi:hypothetical protein
MLNRLTVSALLKAVIVITAVLTVAQFSVGAWESWGHLQSASRISMIADASANLFKAMHNLRTDRSTTSRLLNSDSMDADIEKYLRSLRDGEMPAMANGLALLIPMQFPQHDTLVPEFDRAFKTITALQKEFWEAMGQPKASRRPALNKEYVDITNVLLDRLEKLSGVLAADVNHQDATIDQLLQIKQTAWLLRNTAGEASLIISTGLAAGKVRKHARITSNSSAVPTLPGTHCNCRFRACNCRPRSRPQWPPTRLPISSHPISSCASAC